MIKTAQQVNPFTGKPVTQEFRVKQIKAWINQMPWKYLNSPAPNLDINNPNLDDKTMQAVDFLNKIGKDLGLLSLITGTFKVQQGDLDSAANILFDAKAELSKIISDYENYNQLANEKIWPLVEKIKYIKSSNMPAYFPKPWQPKNVGSYVGGLTHGQFGCHPSQKKPGEGRKPGEGACETPYYNHFLMWGPECQMCGTNGPDPRYLRAKRQFSHLFTDEQIRERAVGKKHTFFIPSPGVAPYIPPPAPGSVYQNINNPDLLDKEVRSEGLKFLSAEDEKDYWKYLKLFNEFKEQEMQKVETAKYINDFFTRFPYKKKKIEHKHGPAFIDPKTLSTSGSTNMHKIFKLANKFIKTAGLINDKELYNALKDYFYPGDVPKFMQSVEIDPKHLYEYALVAVYAGENKQEEKYLEEYLNNIFGPKINKSIVVNLRGFASA